MNTNRSIVFPLIIDAVPVPGTAGLIGMTICPGKDEYAGMGVPSGPWKRDLDLDLQVIRDWQAQALVTLIEEFRVRVAFRSRTAGAGASLWPSLVSSAHR
jgi:hypothetical protein